MHILEEINQMVKKSKMLFFCPNIARHKGTGSAQKYCLLFLFSEIVITVIIKFPCIMGTPFRDYFSTKSPSLSLHFPRVCVRHCMPVT